MCVPCSQIWPWSFVVRPSVRPGSSQPGGAAAEMVRTSWAAAARRWRNPPGCPNNTFCLNVCNYQARTNGRADLRWLRRLGDRKLLKHTQWNANHVRRGYELSSASNEYVNYFSTKLIFLLLQNLKTLWYTHWLGVGVRARVIKREEIIIIYRGHVMPLSSIFVIKYSLTAYIFHLGLKNSYWELPNLVKSRTREGEWNILEMNLFWVRWRVGCTNRDHI